MNSPHSWGVGGCGFGAGKTAFKLYATQAVLSFLQQCKQDRLLYFPHSRDFSFCSLKTQFYFGNRQFIIIF